MIASRSAVSPCSRFAATVFRRRLLAGHGSWATGTIIMLRPQGVPECQTAEHLHNVPCPALPAPHPPKSLPTNPWSALLCLWSLALAVRSPKHSRPPHTPFLRPSILTSPHLTFPSIRVTLYHHHPPISLSRHLLLLSTPAFDFEGNNVFSTSGSQVLHLLSSFQSDRHFCKVNWLPGRTSTEDVLKHQEVRTAQSISFIHTLLDLATTSPNLADSSRTRSRIPARLFG
jgi:hypothetical protein